MLKPLKGGVSNFQVQDQGGAHPIEEKVGTLKNLSSPKSSCAHLMMKLPSSGSTVDLTGSTKSKWQKKCVSSQRQIISARMLADFPRSMYNGPVLPQGHLRSLSSQTSLAIIICCWLRAKGQQRSKHCHSQLMFTATSAIVLGPPSSRSAQCGERSEAPGPNVSPFEAAKWFRTPTGWASVPGAYLPAP